MALHAIGQVGSIGEHPGLIAGGLAGRRGPERPVPAGPRPGELAGEVYGEGAEVAVGVLVGVGRRPAGLLLDEGVGRERAVGGPAVEVQHGGPLRGAADGEGAAPAAPRQWRDSREQGVQVPHVRPHQSPEVREPYLCHFVPRPGGHNFRRLRPGRRSRKKPKEFPTQPRSSKSQKSSPGNLHSQVEKICEFFSSEQQIQKLKTNMRMLFSRSGPLLQRGD